MWGTDCIWYGSPQDQIAAFRAFEITPEFQERFGYPELTAERKAKILGLNALRVFGIEQPVTTDVHPGRAGLRPRRGSAAPTGCSAPCRDATSSPPSSATTRGCSIELSRV